jgi:thiosulfate/3-mercaptopyruvate sulfurtransferase
MKIINNFTFLVAILLLLGVGLVACQNEAPSTPDQSEEHPSAPAVDESSKASVKAPFLVEPEEVKAMLESENPPAVIEISKAEKYEAGHLPGAVNFWRPDYENKDLEYGGMRAPRENMAKLLGDNGISGDREIIIYDTKGSVDAIRFTWILDLYGHDKMRVMNGGKKAWEAAGFSLTTDPAPAVTPVEFTFAGPQKTNRLASFEDMLAAVNDPNVIILDTREPEEYKGVPYIDKGKVNPWKKGAFTFGRIKGSKHLNWSDAVDLNGDHRFKSIKDLKYNFEQAGITPDKTIIAYCQSGVRSSHTTYVLTEILGYPNVKNYDGSWIEWSYNYTQNGDVEIERDISEEEHAKMLADLEAQVNKKEQ